MCDVSCVVLIICEIQSTRLAHSHSRYGLCRNTHETGEHSCYAVYAVHWLWQSAVFCLLGWRWRCPVKYSNIQLSKAYVRQERTHVHELCTCLLYSRSKNTVTRVSSIPLSPYSNLQCFRPVWRPRIIKWACIFYYSIWMVPWPAALPTLQTGRWLPSRRTVTCFMKWRVPYFLLLMDII